jgi:hypothetical protein
VEEIIKMAEFKVRLPFMIYVTTTVEAETEEDALDEAVQGVDITCYCGNGGDDRLIGSWNTDDTLNCGDYVGGAKIITDEN